MHGVLTGVLLASRSSATKDEDATADTDSPGQATAWVILCTLIDFSRLRV